MILFDAISGPTPRGTMPGALPCIVDDGAGAIFGEHVGPIWGTPWTSKPIDPAIVAKFVANVAAKSPGALYVLDMFEDGMDVRYGNPAKNIALIATTLQTARKHGLKTGCFCFPPLGRGTGTITAWQEANDELTYALAGPTKGELQTHITPGFYFGDDFTFDPSADDLMLAEAFRVAGGRPVVPVVNAYSNGSSLPVPLDVQRARLSRMVANGVLGFVQWSDAGLTDQNAAMGQMILALK